VVNRLSAVKIPPFGPRLYLTAERSIVISNANPSGAPEFHILLHDLFVVHRVPDINVGFVWHMRHSRIQVENVWRRILAVEVRIETLHQSCFSLQQETREESGPFMQVMMLMLRKKSTHRACHSDTDDDHRLLLIHFPILGLRRGRLGRSR
jgi:hypothetical protein